MEHAKKLTLVEPKLLESLAQGRAPPNPATTNLSALDNEMTQVLNSDKAVRDKGRMTKGDQIVPLFLMDIFGDYDGLPGLFIAAIFAAALSSVSSAVNSLAALTLEDFIKPIHLKLYKRELSERLGSALTTGFAFIFGVLTIGLSFAAEYMGDKLLEMTLSVWSIFGGPLAGVFIMGFFFPWVNTAGALSGLLISQGLSLWLCIGGLMYKPPTPILPLRMGNTTIAMPTRDPSYHPGGVFQDFYDISYLWYGAFAIGTCLLIGNLVSILSNIIFKNTCKAPTDGTLFYNCADK
ncbi:hypothetical protein CAPTEDRAFT_200791, partial [Capitella teleta]